MREFVMILLLALLALLTPGAVIFDGRARGCATAGAFAVGVGRRRLLALAFVPYGPSGPSGQRVYWRAAIGGTT